MTDSTLAFIGGGNMASSLIGGLIAKGHAANSIWVSDKDTQKLEALNSRFGVPVSADNAASAANADTVVIAVKPQHVSDAVKDVAEHVKARGAQIVSVAAGVREAQIRSALGFEGAIVRCMPNTPALVGAGASALFANEFVSDQQRTTAQAVLDAVGLTVWVDDEASLDAVTALSGSGPAYYFFFIELMEKTAIDLGLPAQTARDLALQTALGAAKMASTSPETPGILRERVTSPGGTTERALAAFRDGGLEELVGKALRAARDRSVELGDSLGDS